MPDVYERINAQCPFFKTCGKYDITCEGVQPLSTTKTIFKEIASRSRYKATYCDRLYKDCRIYEMLEKKYEE